MGEEIRMCDVVEGEPATARYAWSWGEEGFCSEKGKVLLTQTAKNLNRVGEPAFSPLTDGPQEPPLERSERTNLIAGKLAAEGEAEDALKRASKLYDQNVELTSELKSARAREAHLKDANEGLVVELEQSQRERARLSAENGKLVSDISKANVLLESENSAGPELVSLQNQLKKREEQLRELTAEKTAMETKHGLKVKELETELAKLKG